MLFSLNAVLNFPTLQSIAQHFFRSCFCYPAGSSLLSRTSNSKNFENKLNRQSAKMEPRGSSANVFPKEMEPNEVPLQFKLKYLLETQILYVN